MQFKIEPFKYPVKMDPNFAGDLPHVLGSRCHGALLDRASHTVPADKTWAVLEAAIHEIFNQNQSGLSFEELYRRAPAHRCCGTVCTHTCTLTC